MNNEINKTDLDDATPESLMNVFKGPGLIKMIIVTIIIHLIVLGGSSFGFLKKSVFGENTDEMTKEELVKKAISDITPLIKATAKEYGLTAQDISDQFAASGSRTAKRTVAEVKEFAQEKPAAKPEPAPETKKVPVTENAKPTEPISDIEKAITEKADGPEVPVIEDQDDEEEDDLFN